MRLFIILFCIHFSITTYAQDECACCTYESIDNKENFEKLYAPKMITSTKIKSAEVYSTQIVNSDSIKYLQAKFDFNSNGYVIERKWYNRGGKPHSTYIYERNNNHLITKVTFHYLDSLGNIADPAFPDIIDLEYDSNGHVIKLKARDYKGRILPDEKSHFSTFQYDQKGRVKTEFRQSYFEGGDTYIYETTFLYNPKSQLNTLLTKYNGKPWFKSEVSLDKSDRPIQIIATSLPRNILAWKKTFKYDQSGKLIIYNIESGPGSIDECPEQGKFEETYLYTDSGLVSQIDHSYGETICRMVITYR